MARRTNVLGLRVGGRDPAACLLVGGTVRAAVQESRVAPAPRPALTPRPVPHFPAHAIAHCLEVAELGPHELHHVAFVESAAADERIPGVLPVDGVRVGLPELFARHFDLERHELPACFHRVDARRAALANAFYSAPWDTAAVVSLGGFRDPSGVAWGAGFDTALAVNGDVGPEHSLARLTTGIASHLGIDDDPETFEALARRGRLGNGSPNREALQGAGLELVRLAERGAFELLTPADEATLWLELFGPAREAGQPLTAVHFAAAATLRSVLERVALHVLDHLAAETGLDQLCLAGGIAACPGLVGRLREGSSFREVFVPPAPAESGGALGAALDLWHRGLASTRSLPMEHAAYGPHHGSRACSEAVDHYSEELEHVGTRLGVYDDPVELCEEVAARLAAGALVGWFHGRAEWGGRPLGARCLLADPRRYGLRDEIERKLGRPMAHELLGLAVLRERADDWFESGGASPFALDQRSLSPTRRQKLHALKSNLDPGPLWTVSSASAPIFHGLLASFERRTRIPLLVDMPLLAPGAADDARSALRLFLTGELDVLVLGDYLIERNRFAAGVRAPLPAGVRERTGEPTAAPGLEPDAPRYAAG